MTTEHFDIIIVGSGLSGIDAAYHLQAACPRKSYVILESRDAIGGTWDLFRYPGIRSDSDMYTSAIRSGPGTIERAIADGASIRNYIRETAEAYGIDRNIRFRPSRAARLLVVGRRAVDGRGGARADASRFASPAISCSAAPATTTMPPAIRPTLPASESSQAASSIRSTGPKTSTIPASAWW